MIVYLARNRLNGKGYVGKTERGLDIRKKEHLASACLGSRLAFHCAIRKYGFEAFEWSVQLEIHDITDELQARKYLNEREREMIRLFETFGPKGYNMTEGGDGGSLPGRVVSEKTRAKISVVAKKRYVEGHGAFMRARRKKGVEHPFAGKDWGRKGPLTEETKAKISTRRKDCPLSEAHKVAISVSCTGRASPRLGTKWTDSERTKHSTLRYFKKKPVFAYDQAGTCVFAYLSLEDAMTVTGLGWRTLAGDRKKYRPKFVNGVTYKRSELTIEQLKERS